MTMTVDDAKKLLVNIWMDNWRAGYTGYFSDAEILDESLKRKGIAAPKFSHNYKLPDNKSYNDFAKITHERTFYFMVSGNVFPDFRDAKPGTLIYKVKEEVIADAKEIRKEIMEDIKKIKALNPELEHIEVTHSYNAFIMGVISKFAPEDINWFINEKQPSKDPSKNPEVEFMDEMKKIGIQLQGYSLCPKNKEKLLELVKDYQKTYYNLTKGRM